jgi:hypothetical protein
LRGNNWEDPTLDPVERERVLMAQARATEATAPVFRTDWSTTRRLAVAICVALVALYLLVWAGNVQTSGGPEGYVHTTDFVAPLTGAELLRGANAAGLYSLDAQRSVQSSIVAPYGPLTHLIPFDRPPFEAILLAPLLGLPTWFVFALWTMATGLAIGLAVGLLDGALPVTRPVGWVMSMAACSFLPVIRSLMLGQNVAFVLLGLCGAYAALKRGYSGWAGVSLLLVAFKPPLLPVIVLLLLLEGHLKTLAIFGGLLLAVIVGAMPIAGVDWPLRYIGFLASSNAENAASTGGVAAHNWLGFANQVFGSLPTGVAAIVFAGLSLGSVGVLVWAWARSFGSHPGEIDPDFYEYEPASDLLWAVAGVVAVLTSLHPTPDDLALLVFPGWIIGAYATSGLWNAGISRLWVAILTVGYCLAPLAAYAGSDPSRVNSVLVLYVPVLALALVLLAWQVMSPAEGSLESSSA